MTDPDAVTLFVPTRYSESQLRLAEIMAGCHAQAGIKIGNLDAVVRLFCEPAGDAQTAQPVLALAIRGRLWQVSLAQTRYFYDLLAAAAPDDMFKEAPAQALPKEILWAIVESLLGLELSRLEAVMGTQVELAQPDPALPGLELGFTVRCGEDRQVPGKLYLPEDGTDLLESLLAGCEKKRFPIDMVRALEKQIPVRAGMVILDRHDVSMLEPGDVLVPDLWLPDRGQLALGFKSDWLLCTMDTAGMALIPVNLQRLSSFIHINLKSKDDHPMEEDIEPAGDIPEEDNEEMAPAETIPDISDGLELTLVFEIGRIEMNVADIAELAQGKTIRLPARPGEGVGVDIRINDRVMARGRIVSVGRDMGVQITGIGG